MTKAVKRPSAEGSPAGPATAVEGDSLPHVSAQLPEKVRKPTESEVRLLQPDNMAMLLRMNMLIMQYPFFAIQKKLQTKRLEFNIGDAQITISPSGYGQATYWDLDILRYVFSQLNQAVEDQKEYGPEVTFIAHKCLKITGRTTGKAGYVALIDALRRLAGTRIETNIKSGGKRHITGFSWIDSYELLGDDDGDGGIRRLKGIKLKLSDWVYDSLVEDRAVLAFSPDYFALSGGLERRLYDIARKFCGASPFWPVSLVNLHAKIGTTQPLKRLRMELQEIIDADALPDYRLHFVNLPKAVEGKPVPRVNLERLQLRFTRKSMTALSHDDQSFDKSNVIEGAFAVVEPPLSFPDSGTIRYSGWKDLACDSLPRPTPDIDNVAKRFRIWAKEKNIALDSKTIETTFVSFCKKWRLDSH